MTKPKPKINKLIENLSVEERARLVIQNILSPSKLLSAEEERLSKTFATQGEVDEFRQYLKSASEERPLLVSLFLENYQELRCRLVALLALHPRILSSSLVKALVRLLENIPRFVKPDQHQKLIGEYRRVLADDMTSTLEPGEFEKLCHDEAWCESAISEADWLVKRDGSESDFDLEKAALTNALKKTSLVDIETLHSQKIEHVSFRPDTAENLKNAVGIISQEFSALTSLRQAIRDVDDKLGNPPYPTLYGKERLDECIQEIKLLQRCHNKVIYSLLKPSYYLASLGFKREIVGLNDYIIRAPKPMEDAVQVYLNLVK